MRTLHSWRDGYVARAAPRTDRARRERARKLFSRTWQPRKLSPFSTHGLRPGLLDPVGRCGRLVVALAGLRPVRRRRDVADRNGDDPVGVPGRERIFRIVLAEPGDRVLVALVIVGPDVEIARR